MTERSRLALGIPCPCEISSWLGSDSPVVRGRKALARAIYSPENWQGYVQVLANRVKGAMHYASSLFDNLRDDETLLLFIVDAFVRTSGLRNLIPMSYCALNMNHRTSNDPLDAVAMTLYPHIFRICTTLAIGLAPKVVSYLPGLPFFQH
jgi:hypothetical protein